MRKVFGKLGVVIAGAVMVLTFAGAGFVGVGAVETESPDAPSGDSCTSILPGEWCESDVSGDASQNGVWEILQLVLNIMTAGVGVLATIGLVISGIQWMTARDNEAQIVKAKSRIFNIVIGIVVWALMWVVLSWLMPGGLGDNVTKGRTEGEVMGLEVNEGGRVG